MNRQVYIEQIIRNLSQLKCEVELRNTVSLFDINIIAENFYADFLNIMYDAHYVNVNMVKKNTAGIDLIDEKKKESYTSNIK